MLWERRKRKEVIRKLAQGPRRWGSSHHRRELKENRKKGGEKSRHRHLLVQYKKEITRCLCQGESQCQNLRMILKQNPRCKRSRDSSICGNWKWCRSCPSGWRNRLAR